MPNGIETRYFLICIKYYLTLVPKKALITLCHFYNQAMGTLHHTPLQDRFLL